jgi:NitT/TauT family transport system substrate-binding protein
MIATQRSREEKTMNILQTRLSRRQTLAAAGAGLVAAAAGGARSAWALEPIRQGYQTNMWGMPTYYLMHSGHLEKHGLKVQDFAVPSGNLTMQQMVARQVDLGTYAGPSLLIGYARGGLVGIAQIETVGKTVQVMGRKDLNLKKVEDLRGKKVANQTGSSVGNVFVDQIAPAHGLKQGDYQEVRMDVNDMVAALLSKTVDAMVNVEPYNAIAEAQGVATTIMDYESVDKMPVFMAATPDFIAKSPDTVVAYLKAWLDVAKDFKTQPDKVADVIYGFYSSKGYQMSKDTFKKAIAKVEVKPGFPPDSELDPYMKGHAEELLKAKKIKELPDLSKVLQRQFMQKAMA